MPVYQFEGRKEDSGEVVRGVREAASHTSLGQELLAEGVLLTRYVEQKSDAPGASIVTALFKRVPVIEKALFARYFALMLRAGLDVKRALEALKEQSRNKVMQGAVESLHQDIERGRTLSEAMKAFPNVFPELFVSFVRVGEETGNLQESLEILAEQLQKEYELSRAVRGGLMYPAVIIMALIAVGIAMMYFVVPKLVEVFEGFEVELPFATRVLIYISDVFQQHWLLLIVGAIFTGLGGWFLMRVERVRVVVLHGFLYVPVIGSIMKQVNLARFSRSLGSLLHSGVSYVEALGILGTNTPHPSYAEVFLQGRDQVKEGKTLSDFLRGHQRLFPPIVINIISIGEETGALDQVLEETALFYEGEVDQTMKNLTSIMEPVLMIAVGLAVGALAVSVISPIYDLVNVI